MHRALGCAPSPSAHVIVHWCWKASEESPKVRPWTSLSAGRIYRVGSASEMAGDPCAGNGSEIQEVPRPRCAESPGLWANPAAGEEVPAMVLIVLGCWRLSSSSSCLQGTHREFALKFDQFGGWLVFFLLMAWITAVVMSPRDSCTHPLGTELTWLVTPGE